MARSFTDVMEEYKSLSTSKSEQGNIWERMVSKILLEDVSLTGTRFSNIWLWNDWPYRGDVSEIGVDLVAKEKDTGDFVAIQAKFYDKSSISKKDVDTFLSTSGRSYDVNGEQVFFSRRILISTNNKWSEHALKAITNQKPRVEKITKLQLEDSQIDWEKFSFKKPEEVLLKEKYDPKEHQNKAIGDVLKGFKKHNRGKLIMACGTGKTFTSLRLAEKQVKSGGWVLFLVPSISLLSQSLKEWHSQAKKKLNTLAVCSDPKVTKRKKISDEDIYVDDLAAPATTDLKSLQTNFNKLKTQGALNVVFCTYHSVEIISKAQKDFFPDFDLVICDEAHRTTGIELAGKDKSHFVMVHDDDKIKTKKRLYMTATPKIFGERAKAKADEAAAILCDMDDESLYGPEFHKLDFARAVDDGLLTDYKVLVLAIEDKFAGKVHEEIDNENKELKLEDLQKLIGCWNGLSKKTIVDEEYYEIKDRNPMKRAVAYCGKIDDSKNYAEFTGVTSDLLSKLDSDLELICEAKHVDGNMSSIDRDDKISWLKEEPSENRCKILSNARCLSEGIDVPSLDAVIFFSPRASKIDVVQSVGRVMRKPKDGHRKDYGYVILPIGIPSGMTPEEALKDNKRYKVVWDVLNALRSHDANMESVINSIELNKNKQKKIIISTPGENYVDTDSLLENLQTWKEAILTKIVKKVGERRYWEDWIKDIAKTSSLYTSVITDLSKSKSYKSKFEEFHRSLVVNLNPSIGMKDAIDLLAQHLATRPIFNALFEDYDFINKNPVAKDIEAFLSLIKSKLNIGKNSRIDDLVIKIKRTVSNIDNAEAKQTIIKELYEKFFKEAFPEVQDRLGVVYTPNEVVDFIIKSVDYLYKEEFGKSIASEGVHILDPFTGTGTFIARLIQSGVISNKTDMIRKYRKEIHANELILLAYYVACINIEECFHDVKGFGYEPFKGALLTDTFQMYEAECDLMALMLEDNTSKLEKQRTNRPNVIIGNPPYSKGKKSENDSYKKTKYVNLDKRIKDTYSKESTAKNVNSLYNSYIKAIRWSSDRLDEGIIGFVTNGNFAKDKSADGMRKCLQREFSKIIIFNLKGDQNTQGEVSRREGGKIFGGGSKSPISITFFIKNKKKTNQPCEILYHEVDDYLSREEKLAYVKKAQEVKNLDFVRVEPNNEGDWVKRRSKEFSALFPIDPNDGESLFNISSLGAQTGRDWWLINSSKSKLEKNVKRTIKYYNEQVNLIKSLKEKSKKVDFEKEVGADAKYISWSSSLKTKALSGIESSFSEKFIREIYYRPLFKQHVYFDPHWVHRKGSSLDIFPNAKSENVIVSINGFGSSNTFSCFASKNLIDYEFISKGRCYPLYSYKDGKQVFNISKSFIESLNTKYNLSLEEVDLFHYLYGVLNSEEYVSRYADDLDMALVRIPFLDNHLKYIEIGEKLLDMHANFDEQSEFELEVKKSSNLSKYKFNKIRYGDGKDKSILKIDESIVVSGIPLEVYKFIVNGKSLIDWIIDRYTISCDEGSSGITNDANDAYDVEYVISLIKKSVFISLETLKLRSEMPVYKELN